MTNKPLLGPRKTKDDKKLHWEGSSEHLRKALDLSKIVTRRFGGHRRAFVYDSDAEN